MNGNRVSGKVTGGIEDAFAESSKSPGSRISVARIRRNSEP